MQAAFTAASANDVVVIMNGTYGIQAISGSAKLVTFYAQTYDSVLVGGLTENRAGSQRTASSRAERATAVVT